MNWHDAANIFPLDEEHIDELAEDIKANGLGIRVPKRTRGPTARPFARVTQSQTYRSSISMPCFSQSRRYSSWKELVA